MKLSDTVSGEILAKEFKEHSVAEFFKKNLQMLGLTGKTKTLTTIVHEYVTNSLDACEEAGIIPDIEVRLAEIGNEYYEVTVTDNGPGMTRETVGKALGKLLAGTKFHRLIQSRGQQGIGASGCTMLSQITTGKETKVLTGTDNGETISCEISIDTKHNVPKISNLKKVDKDFRGTAIKARFKGVKYINNEQSPLEYLRRTAIANPHAQISFIEPSGNKTSFPRTTKQIPKRPSEIKPHPKGVTVDELISLSRKTDARKVFTFLKNDFDRMGDKAISVISKKVSYDLNKDPKQLTWDEAEETIQQFREINFIAPRLDALMPIGEERINKSMNIIVEPEFLSVITRKPSVYRGGFPFQVEASIAYGGKAGRKVGEENRVEIMRFANRAPLLFDQGGCAITKAVQSIDWKRYEIKDVDHAPLTIFVNLISVHIPYTGAGKQAISDDESVLEELRLAIMDAARKTSRYISGKRREQEKQMKRQLFLKYIPEIAGALGHILKKEKEPIIKKMEKLVLDKLKLEEIEEQKANSDNGKPKKESKEEPQKESEKKKKKGDSE